MEESHSLSIEQCKRITATAIESVDAFSPTRIALSFAGGKIIIEGNGLKIVNFSKSGGSFSAIGEVYGAKYAAKGGSLKQKLFR